MTVAVVCPATTETGLADTALHHETNAGLEADG
ncbi:MAG: hypothetical protein ACI9PP_000841 [Halobacteriales archaeon]|jgi:hypothetical protein